MLCASLLLRCYRNQDDGIKPSDNQWINSLDYGEPIRNSAQRLELKMGKFLKIYGERNTNTNYMSELIRLNLNVTEVSGVVPPVILKAQKILPGKELLRDAYFRLNYRKNLGWKHACVKCPGEFMRYEIVKSISGFLTITKNPYSWLLSLYRRPYHQYYKDSPSFEAFLLRKWKTVGRDNIKGCVENPIMLWNIKNRSYLQLDRERTINTTTEKVFEAPEEIIQKISRDFNIERKSENFLDYGRSTKDKSKDGDYYRKYYLSEKWREGLSDEAVAIINETIDKKLMRHFDYSLLK